MTEPELLLTRGREKVEEEQMVRSEAGSWRRLPQFSTASDQRRRSYHWRKFPILSRRRSDGKPGRYLIVFNYVDIMYLALLASQAKEEVKIVFLQYNENIYNFQRRLVTGCPERPGRWSGGTWPGSWRPLRINISSCSQLS